MTLPDLTQDLAADVTLPRFAVGHHSVARRDNPRRQAAANGLELRRGLIDAKARLADSPNVANNRLASIIVSKVDPDSRELRFSRDLVTRDVAFGFKDLENFYFDCAMWDRDARVL